MDVYAQYKEGPDGERDYSVGDVHEKTRAGLDMVCSFEVKRPLAKIANFALLYGMVEISFAIAFELAFDVAGEARNGFFATYPRLGAITDELGEQWRFEGVRKWRIPFSGRRRIWDTWIWENGVKEKNQVSKGNIFNTLVQGSAADVLKAGLAMFWEKVAKHPEYEGKIFPLMQVHDEVVIEVHKSVALEVACLLKFCMEYEHFKTEIPILADAFIVDRWSEGKEGKRPVFVGKPYHSEEVKAQKFDDKGNPVLDEERQPVFKVEEEELYPEWNGVLRYLHKDHKQWCREFLFPDGKEPEPIYPHTDFVARDEAA